MEMPSLDDLIAMFHKGHETFEENCLLCFQSELSRLRAELAELRESTEVKELVELRQYVAGHRGKLAELNRENRDLRADNEQLRKALELAVEDVAARFISSNTTIADYIDMAKQALGEKP